MNAVPPGKGGWIRWRAVGPLAGFIVLVVLAWWLFVDRLGRMAIERGGTSILGARVELRSFQLSLARGDATLRGLVVASPFDSLENLFEADELVADLDMLPLVEKKVVIDRLAANGLRFATKRTTSGFVKSSGPSATAQIRANVEAWAAQPGLQVPVLQLATGKLSIDSLDPRRLETVQAAQALTTRADSSRRAWGDAVAGLAVGPTVDSAAAFVQRVHGAKPTDLKVLADARRTLDQVKQTRDRLTALERNVTGGVSGLQQGVTDLGAARARDYAFAKTLVKLPPIDASAIGWVLFGPAAVHKFQRALYYSSLARAYMPAGLRPQPHPAPSRLAGTTVAFPRANALPAFLLRQGELSFSLAGDSGAVRNYSGRVLGLTSDPAVYGKPTSFTASAPAVRLGALLDHVRETARDTAGGSIEGVQLPELRLPGLPIHLAPGRGVVALNFAMHGDSLRGRWTVNAPRTAWLRDSSAATSAAGDLVWQVVSGLTQLDLTAEITGTVQHPELHVRSNLDQAVADRVRAMIGAEVSAAEARVRAQVDQLVGTQVDAAKARVTEVATAATNELQQRRAQLEQAQRNLEQEIRRRTGGLRLP